MAEAVSKAESIQRQIQVIVFDTITIEEATDRLIDYRGKTPPKTDSGVRLITAKVVKGGQILEEPAEFIAEDFYDEWMRRGLPQKLDVLITTEAPLGELAILRGSEKIALAQRIILLRAKPGHVDPVFLFYALQSDFGQGELKARGSGTTVLGIKQSELRKVRIPIFPLGVQRRIAGILSAYDELMENSQRRIRILEAMARALYREWFVHFRFPGHEKHPHVASPLGNIPQGWEVTTFGELYNTGSGGTPSRARPEYFEDGTIDWVKSQELLDGFVLSTEERITERALKESSAKLFPANAVLIALYGATIGKLAILSRTAATNQACCAVLAKRPGFGREFAFLTLLLNRERIIGLRLGAAQQNISQVLLRNFECLKPADELVRRFSEQTAPLFDGILTLQRQIQTLRRTRDLLLPRLLSGQVGLEST